MSNGLLCWLFHLWWIPDTSGGRFSGVRRSCRSPAWTWRTGCPPRWWSCVSPGGTFRWLRWLWSWWIRKRIPARILWRLWRSENEQSFNVKTKLSTRLTLNVKLLSLRLLFRFGGSFSSWFWRRWRWEEIGPVLSTGDSIGRFLRRTSHRHCLLPNCFHLNRKTHNK